MSEPARAAGRFGPLRRAFAPALGLLGGMADHLAAVATAPEYRRLRRLLLLSAAVQLVLAPLTSWSIDTNTFVQSGAITLYTGNPYAGGSWYNPPLGAFLPVPSLGILTAIVGPNGLFQSVPSLGVLAARTGFPTVLPTPAALLAWKLPFIIAGLSTGVVIDWILRFRVQGFAPETGAAAWLLNPVVIWAIAVHGEVDGLAALWVVLALVAVATRHWFAGGLSLTLGFFTKGYPVALVPLLLAWLLLTRSDGPWSLRKAAARIGWAAAGAAVAILPFAGYVETTLAQLTARSTVGLFGAVSVTVIFNPAVPKGYGPYFAFASNPANGSLVLDALIVLAVGGYVTGLLLFGWALRHRPSSDRPELTAAALVGSGVVAGVLLADPIPNAENLLGLVPLLILAVPLLPNDWGLRLLTGVSFSGLFQYFSILTPFAYFYPAAALLGPGAVNTVTRGVLVYLDVPGLRGMLWLLVGVIGGSFIIATVVCAVWYLLPESTRARVRWRRREVLANGAPG